MAGWRNVLVVTGGSTPQVVTETIYALATRPIDPIVPAKIICAVTKGVANSFGPQFEAMLLRLKQSHALSVDWERRDRAWHTATSGLFVQFPRYQDGRSVEDIRSDADAVHFGDLVSEIVRTETLHEDSRVHLSLAGGRKTMSFHGGAAMSLFGRAQDELSHVLVYPSDFEACADFWFPSNESIMVHHRDGRTFDASQARLELSSIPFLRVRNRLPEQMLYKSMNYAGHVAQTNAALGRSPLFLELITSERRVRIGDLVDFTLSNSEFALYQLMAEWKCHGHKGAGPRGLGQDHEGWLTAKMFEYPEQYVPNPVDRYIKIYAETFKSATERADNMLNSVTPEPANEKQRKGNKRNFEQWKSRLIDNLQKHLHDADLGDRFGAPLAPRKARTEINGMWRNLVVFGLRLEPREIIIRVD
jgi:CRISPR-associated protein (TIGR02584 family)